MTAAYETFAGPCKTTFLEFVELDFSPCEIVEAVEKPARSGEALAVEEGGVEKRA